MTTRKFWPLSNHSGGDGRFPTCGAAQNVLKKFNSADAREILGTRSTKALVVSTSSEGAPSTSTPVTFRARLRRPMSWASSDEVFSPPVSSAADSGVAFSPEAVMGLDTKKGPTRMIDLGAVPKTGTLDKSKDASNPVNSPRRISSNSSGDYSLSKIWDRVREEKLCKKCSR